MPVDRRHFPSECCEFLGERIKARVGFRGAAEALKIVVVHCRNDVVETQRGSHQHRFPGRAFLHLAVAEHSVNNARALARPLG
jgi:hypothetical protein